MVNGSPPTTPSPKVSSSSSQETAKIAKQNTAAITATPLFTKTIRFTLKLDCYKTPYTLLRFPERKRMAERVFLI